MVLDFGHAVQNISTAPYLLVGFGDTHFVGGVVENRQIGEKLAFLRAMSGGALSGSQTADAVWFVHPKLPIPAK